MPRHEGASAVQAHRSWIVKMSEWALEPLAGNVRLGRSSYSLGLNTARAAAHIIVYDRYRQVRRPQAANAWLRCTRQMMQALV